MSKTGRNDRLERITQQKVGPWATTSQYLLWTASRLFDLSRQEPRFVYAGLPLLMAALHSFALEYERFLTHGQMPGIFTDKNLDLAKLMKERYAVPGDLLEDLRDLIELRNEIIHPSPLPTGTRDNWPDYLRRVKDKGLLTTSGGSAADYLLLDQIASYRLFSWAVQVTRKLYSAVVNSDPMKAHHFHRYLTNFDSLFGLNALNDSGPI